ncbi:integrase arm-type DNA-binding domain-containing protein [Accumulibacter sp.]|uniref:tyrosine-type recombinase/integrase n=1 Tax=Accumulibacter sp. TaxID=2053492 RepID=UPI001DDD2CB1|nr:integrase arm-type DNA-binding domain-containing protein [Accumulibacter sp.]MCB1967138.1 integrase family protein [Accumulibacter sp.]MCP5229789.1 integrase family protein [Accumulibacter sp.]
MGFDARAIKLLQPGQHITSAEAPGLRVEAHSDRTTWTYRYRSPLDQRLRQVKIGMWPAVSVHAAFVAWEKLRDQRDSGRDPAAEARSEREQARLAIVEKGAAASPPYTVAQVCYDYWQGHVAPTRASKGVTEVKRMFDRMLCDTGNLEASRISRAQAFDLIKRYAETAPVQAGKLRAELGAAWDYAVDSGRLPESCPNWWRLIMRGKIRSKGKQIAGEKVGTAQRVLSADEVGALIRWLPNFSRLIEDALTLYLWTCTRGAEIVGMQGREIHREADGLVWWVIPKARTKSARHENSTDLRVPLFGRSLAVAMRRKDRYGDGLLFPTKTRDGKIRAVEQKTIQATVYFRQPYCQTRVDTTRARLPVSRWSPHDLRRTSRTLLAAMGCPDAVGESILGHMLPGVLGVYNKHAYDSERAGWLKRLSDHLEYLAASV